MAQILEPRPVPGFLSVNMKLMHKWATDSQNIRFFDSIQKSQGKFFTLDARAYIEFLNEFGIFYTLKTGFNH